MLVMFPTCGSEAKHSGNMTTEAFDRKQEGGEGDYHNVCMYNWFCFNDSLLTVVLTK